MVQVSEGSLSYICNKVNQIPVFFSLLGLLNRPGGVPEMVKDGPCYLVSWNQLPDEN